MSAADVFSLTEAHHVWLQIDCLQNADGQYNVRLVDEAGNNGAATLTDPDDEAVVGDSGVAWRQFLKRYTDDDVGTSLVTEFGNALFRLVIAESGLHGTWNSIRTVAKSRPLSLVVECGQGADAFSSLPLELLRDSTGFVFQTPGSSLLRVARELQSMEWRRPQQPRVLFAWACPEGSGDQFDPEPHEQILRGQFGDDVTILPNVTRSQLETELQNPSDSRPYDFLHLLVHGVDGGGAITLASEHGMSEPVLSQELGNIVAGSGVSFCFLCSCQTAVTPDVAFSGVGQQLLTYRGGDLACVVATQANLRVNGSGKLVERFYQLLMSDIPDVATALNYARNVAYSDAIGWSVPIVLQRPTQGTERARPSELARREISVPLRRATFLDRDEVLECVEAIQQHRLVGVVGLPGIGKTQIGEEFARRAEAAGLADQVVYATIQSGDTVDALRARLSFAVSGQAAESDVELGVQLQQSGSTILLLDNAEDLMLTTDSELSFADQLETLLEHSPSLRILLTTRWLPLTAGITIHEVEVPPLSLEQCSELLQSELTEFGVFEASWPASDGWQRLLELIDGHARSLWLVSHHFRQRSMTPDRVAGLLESHRDQAVVDDPGLIGRPEVLERLSDRQKRRLKSLVGSMGLSFDVLKEQHSEAAELFAAFSLYVAGLPESVADALADVAAGDSGTVPLITLSRYHLIAWDRERRRYFFPVPLQWYADSRQRSSPVDAALYDVAAAAAFAEFTAEADAIFLRDEVMGVRRLLPELQTLQRFCESLPTPRSKQRSDLAKIANASRNALRLASYDEILQQLAVAGRRHAASSNDHRGQAGCLLTIGLQRLRVSDLAGAREAYEEALPIYREISDRLGEANCLQSLGDLRMRVDDLAGAREAYEEALPIYREISDRLGEANCLQSLGDLRMRVDDLAGAREAYEEALPIYREISDRLGEANCLQSLGDLRMRVDDLAGAREAYEEALPIYREISARLGEANCLKSLGDLRMRVDDPDGAREAYEEALPIYREISARLGEANCLKSLGDLRRRVSDPAGAREAYEEALPIYREISDRLGEANCLKSLGDLRRRVSDLAGAREAYEEALPIYREISARLGEANCLKSLGDLRMRVSDPAGAREAYEEALPIYREISARLGEANCLQSLGDLRMRVSDPAGAREAYEEALPIFREISDRLGEANCLQSLGDLRMRVSDPDGAREAYEEALPIFRKISERLGEANCRQSMGLLQMQYGDPAGAFHSMKAVLELHDSIQNELGKQAALGYLARIAHAVDEVDQAILLAEQSLNIGTAINDRFGQTITLNLQMRIWMEASEMAGVLGSAAMLAELHGQIGPPEQAEMYESLVRQASEELPEDAKALLASDPNQVRLAAVAQAAERFKAAGRDLLTPPPESE